MLRMVRSYAGGCHDFLEQASPETRAELNRLLKEYKKVKLQQIDKPLEEMLVETPFEFDFTEISVDSKGRIRQIREKERRREEREFQRTKKEVEDR